MSLRKDLLQSRSRSIRSDWPIVIPRALDEDSVGGSQERLEQTLLVRDPERRPLVLAVAAIGGKWAGAAQRQTIGTRVQHHHPRRAAAGDRLYEQSIGREELNPALGDILLATRARAVREFPGELSRNHFGSSSEWKHMRKMYRAAGERYSVGL